MTTAELKEKTTGLISEEVTLTTLNFCLISAVALFAGILIGMLIAPVTRGIHLSFFSHNGNGSGNHNGNNCGSTISAEPDEERDNTGKEGNQR